MPATAKPLELDVVTGGRLITTFSQDNVGQANYVRKVNLRRIDKDREGRREGWIKFRPDTVSALGTQHLNSGVRQNLLVETKRPNGERTIVSASKTTIKRFNFTTMVWDTIGTGFSANGKRWQWATLNGYLILNNTVDLPVTFRVEESAVVPMYELREAGVASVGFIEESNGFLLLANIVEIQATAQTGIMNGGTGGPYGIITDATKLNQIPFEIISGEFGLPRNWAPKFTVTMAAASATIVLPWTSSVFVAGTTKVAVLNAGPSGGVLGGQSDSPDGVLVNTVVGATLTLAKSTDAGLTYPRDVIVMRWSDQSTLVGKYKPQDDGSAIIGFKSLNNVMCVYRNTSIYTGRYVGTVGAPFEFRKKYEGTNVPKWSDAIVSVNKDYQLYPAEGGRFYSWDGLGPDPTLHKTCDDARNLIFEGTTPASDVWAIDNPLTKEVWFCRQSKTLAYDYEFNTCSEIDAEIHAAAYITRPNSQDKWFIIGIEGIVYTYGLVKTAAVETLTWLRDGVAPVSLVKFGLFSLGSAMIEKDLHGYILKLGTGTLDLTIQLKLYSTEDAHVAPILLLTDAITGPTYFWPMFYKDVFFQDEISVISGEDRDLQLVGRILDRSPVGSHGVTRLP